MKIWNRVLVIASVVLSTTTVISTTAGLSLFAVPTIAEEKTWKVNLKDADIRAFIAQVADITGYSFIIDPRVKGKVTIVSQSSMNTEDVYQMFLSVLGVHGYAAIPAGEVIKIVQQNNVKQGGTKFDKDGKVEGEEIVTRVLTIKNTPALDLVALLRPLVAKHGHLAGVKTANALIISDHASNIDRIEDIIERLDSTGSAEMEVIQLKEAWVGDVVKMLESLDPEKVAKGNKSTGGGRIRVVADERANRLILSGEKSVRENIRELVSQLDQPTEFSGSTQVILLQHADAKEMAEILKGLMGDIQKDQKGKGKGGNTGTTSIHADEGLNALVVRAEPTILGELKDIVAQLDVRRAQVLIEAAIVEVSGDVSDQFGFQWVTGDGTTGVPAAATNFSNAGPSISGILGSIAQGTAGASIPAGLTIGAVDDLNNPTIGSIVNLLESVSNANLLSTPSIMTLDNQEAEIIVGQNVPFRTGSTLGNNNANPFTQIKREDVGISLKVTPQINDGDVVRLEVEQSAESVVEQAIEGQADLITNKRSIKTQILADDLQTIVLGGLVKDDVIQSESKVPLLGDIPLIGWLFRSESEKHVKQNLLVFLRPTIIREEKQSLETTDRKFRGIYEIELSDQISTDAMQRKINSLFDGR